MPNPPTMLTAGCLLVALALVLCALGVRKTFRVLELDPMQALVWIGLAEHPLPDVPRRRA